MWSQYEIAGRQLHANSALAELAAFRVHGAVDAPAPRLRFVRPAGGLTVRQSGWVGGKVRDVAYLADEAGYYLQVEGGLELAVAPDGAAIGVARADGVPHTLVVEGLLGPALVLALALQGLFCLHASAVTYGGHGVAFIGPSGAGKSTLAHLLSRDHGWRRAADDILPVEVAAGAAVARPRFPQLKLTPAEQGALATGIPEGVPLGAVYVLEQPDDPTASVAVTHLAPHRAVFALVAQSVAARLFTPDVLDHHLKFCADVAMGVPVRRLAYPHRPSAVAAVAALVQADLAGATA